MMARRRLSMCSVVLATWLALLPAAAHGHGGSHPGDWPRTWSELPAAWEFDLGVVIPLVISGIWYLVGICRLWSAAGVGRGIQGWQASCFLAGWMALVIALVSPLHQWGNALFSVHMVQHELLMLVCAPLLVVSQPIVAMFKAVPISWSRLLTGLSKQTWFAKSWHWLTHPLCAWLVHAAVLWLWHIPALFDATLKSDLIHALQHLSFLLSALLFWWAVLCREPWRASLGISVLYMFTTAIHSGFLGALITFATTAWYPGYFERTQSWRLTPLEDQQLGGLVMWVPACSIYIAVGLATFVVWLKRSERNVTRWEREQTARHISIDHGGVIQP
jgi:putative membrane protein